MTETLLDKTLGIAPAKKGKVFLSPAATIQAGILLQQHLFKVEGTDAYRYEDGWSDDKIAEVVGGPIDKTHIARLRSVSLGMPLFQTKPGQPVALDPRVTALIEAHNKLCDLISLNRIADARGCKLE